MTDKVRVRYAPSPTGATHVGNVRTAIFNWLFARHTGGTFIIRVEDTDQSRKIEGATDVMLEALRWLGLDWDEGPDIGGDYGPYYQSERLQSYQQVADQLVKGDQAYLCYCSAERLTEMREEQQRRSQSPGYDRRCRDMSEEERLEHQRGGVTPVVRFKMPLDGTTVLNDIIHGEISFDNRLVDDYVMLKSDGFPTYHLANVIDDHHMEISHVMRGDDWISSSPRHLQLYNALGWKPPQYAHLPMILASDRSKLSKRHGATSILEFREMGYLPQTMVNFLSLLGWSLDDKTEIFSADELKKHFTIERVSKAGAIFNTEKLNWMNGAHIRQMSENELADALLDYWRRCPPAEIPELPDNQYLLKMIPLIQERIKELRDAAPLLSFFFKKEPQYESAELVQKGMDANGTKESLNAALAGISELASFNSESIEEMLRPLAKELNVKAGQLFGSLRVATTGLRVAPPLFETMEVLGKERTLVSIQSAIDRL